MPLFRWSCRDRRYQIRLAMTSPSQDYLTSTCLWYSNYSILPSDLECTLKFCDQSTNVSNTDGHNFDFQHCSANCTNNINFATLYADNLNGRTHLGNSIIYPCKSGYSIESNLTVDKALAATSIQVVCGLSGEYIYPDPWPQCSSTVYCPDPGQMENLTRQDLIGSNDYQSVIR